MCGGDGGDGDGYDGEGYDDGGFEGDGEFGDSDFEMDGEGDFESDTEDGGEYDPDIDIDAGIEASHEYDNPFGEYDPDIDVDAMIEASHENDTETEAETEIDFEISENMDNEVVGSINNHGNIEADESAPEYDFNLNTNSEEVENIDFKADDPDINIRSDENEFIDIYHPDEHKDAIDEATVLFNNEDVEDGPQTENPGLNLGRDHELNEELTHEFKTNTGVEIGIEANDTESKETAETDPEQDKEISPKVQETVYEADLDHEKIHYQEELGVKAKEEPLIEEPIEEDEPEDKHDHYYYAGGNIT